MDFNNAPWYPSYGDIIKSLDYPDVSMYELLRQTAVKYPNFTAYEYMGTKTDYQTFISQTETCAAALKKRGIRKNDRVSICMPNCPQAVIMFYGLNLIGAVANMIHPLSGENEIAEYISFSKSRAIVIPDIFYPKLQAVEDRINVDFVIVTSMADALPVLWRAAYKLTEGRKIKKVERNEKTVFWRDFIKSAANEKAVRADGSGSDVAAILYSGGTTGTTKGIELSNLNFNACAMQTAAAADGVITAGDKILAVMPVFHGFGLGICVHTALTVGGDSILVPRFLLDTFIKALKKDKPNFIAGVPTLFEALLRSKKTEDLDLSCLRGIFSGGDSLPDELKTRVDAFLAAHGSKEQVREGYGLTECVTASCLTPRKKHKKGSIGVPFPDTFYKIVEPGTENELPFSQEGEIVISGPSVMKGYLDRPDETAKVLKIHSDGRTWLHTGDLGMMDDEGFIYFKQRLKRVIVTSGFNVYPSQVENVIDGYEAVHLSCVIGVRDDYKMKRVKAFVVLKDGYEPSEELKQKIREHCLKNVARYAMPKEIEFRTELPKTLVGKVAYTELEKEENDKQGGNKNENS